MLQDDKGESVRDAVVKSLGILVAFIDDEDKFKQVHVFLTTPPCDHTPHYSAGSYC